MGKTEMIKFPMADTRGNNHPSSLNLSKSELGGVVFGCNNKTMRECLEKQLFGLPSSHFSYVKNIEPGLTLFLFDYNDRRMHGIYEAASVGEMNIDPYAWTDNGKEKTSFPAQVRIRSRTQCQPITENQFKEVLRDNYYKPQHFWFELSHAQTEGLLAMFLASNPSPNRMTLPTASSEENRHTVPEAIMRRLVPKFKTVHSAAVEPKNARMLSDPVDEKNSTTSILRDVNPLVKIVNELKERTAKLEVKQFARELEIQELTNVAMDSGAEIQRLKSRVVELESKCLQHSRNTAFLIGGFNGNSWLSTLDAFSPSTDKLVPLKAMGSARSYASAAALNNDSFYVFGGGDGSSWFDTVECYSLENDSWSSCPPLVRPKGSLAGVTLDNKIFALGGGDGSECFSDVEMFDPALGRWTYIQPMLQKRYAPAAAVLHDAIYATGGFDGRSFLRTAERFDPREGNWTELPNMRASRGSHSMVVINEKLFAIGGFDGITMSSSVETYDPRKNSWLEGDSMNFARGYASVAQLGSHLFIIGGVGDNDDIVETVECYRDGFGWKKCTYEAIGKRCFGSAVVMSVSGSLDSLGNRGDGA